MARKTSDLEQVRRALYKAQRGIGDFQAAERGLTPLLLRLARRQVRRRVGRATKGWL